MSVFIPTTGIDNVRALATSALPDAPVQPDDPRPSRHLLKRLVMRLRGTITGRPAPAVARPAFRSSACEL